MADYKDYINGAISFVSSKVKGFTEETNIKDLYDEGRNIATDISSMAKIKVNLTRDREELRRTYIEIGKLCYEENKGNADEFFTPLFDKIEQLTKAIEVEELEIQTLKDSIIPKDVSDSEVLENELESPIDVIEFGKPDNPDSI